MTNNRSAVGLEALEETKIRSEVHVTRGTEPSKWRRHLRRAISNSPVSRVMSRLPVGDSYTNQMSTPSPPLCGSYKFIDPPSEVSNEHDSSYLCLLDNPEHKFVSPHSSKCSSTQQHIGAANLLSNVALTQFLCGSNHSASSECNDTIPSTPGIKNSTDEGPPIWNMEQLRWTGWVVPVIVKRHGAVNAIVLSHLALYILEMLIKDSDMKEAVGCTYPSGHFSLGEIASYRAILRLEPSDLVKVLIPYHSNILEDESEVAEKGSDLYLCTQSGTFVWFKLRTNQHRGELLDCIDEWYSVFMGGNDELLVEQCCYDAALSHITEISCDCFVSSPLGEE